MLNRSKKCILNQNNNRKLILVINASNCMSTWQNLTGGSSNWKRHGEAYQRFQTPKYRFESYTVRERFCFLWWVHLVRSRIQHFHCCHAGSNPAPTTNVILKFISLWRYLSSAVRSISRWQMTHSASWSKPPPFQGGVTGSNPVCVTILKIITCGNKSQ